MKIFVKVLVTVLMLSVAQVRALDLRGDVDAWLAQDPDNINRLEILKSWDNIITNALAAQKTSTTKRILKGVGAEASKAVLTVALFALTAFLIKNKKWALATASAAATPLPLGLIDFVNKMETGDPEFFKVLQAMSLFADAINHVKQASFKPDLTPDLRKALVCSFKKQYRKALREKFEQEKDGFGIRAGSVLVSLADFVIPLPFVLLGLAMREAKKDNSSVGLALSSSALLMWGLQIVMLVDNVSNSDNKKIELLLQKIEASFGIDRR